MTLRRSVLLALLLAAPLGAQTFDVITNLPAPPGTDIIRIDRPNPTQRLTEYRSILLLAGDLVTVHGEGCVQTGGSGKTWKRYVNPSGANTDHLYHGLVWIPGATSSLVRVEGVQDKPLNVTGGLSPDQMFLRLGYEDDDYGDNSYNDHDDGTEDQCRGTGGGPASVTVTVKHASAPVSRHAPFDLVATEFDSNGLMLNPKWGEQVNSGNPPGTGLCGQPWLPPCTTQAPSIDKAAICAGSGLLGGHGNWAAATYEGLLVWENHSAPGQDDDYSLNLHTPERAGATVDRPESVHIEFDSDETIDHFRTPWWSAFHEAVDKFDDALSRPLNPPHEQMVNGKFAIVTGLMGLDLGHNPSGESHPVWAIAIRAQEDPADELWAMFVRNWGNEGYCSTEQHFVDFIQNRYTVRLPWRTGATSVQVIEGKTQFLTNNSSISMEVSIATGVGVFVSFTLPRPEEFGRVHGEIHLQWTGAEPLPPPPEPRRIARDGNEAEDRAAAQVSKMTPRQRTAFLAALPQKKASFDQIQVRRTTAVRGRALPLPQRQNVRVRSAPDAAKAARDRQRVDALRSATAPPPR